MCAPSHKSRSVRTYGHVENSGRQTQLFRRFVQLARRTAVAQSEVYTGDESRSRTEILGARF